MINYYALTPQQYVDQLISMISSFEGHRPVAALPPGAPNVTIGYGYTFVRNNNFASDLTTSNPVRSAGINATYAARRFV
jgi:hypothetical protein